MTTQRTNTATYYVLDEHTLGYVYDAQPQVLGVLGSDVHGIPWTQGLTWLLPSSNLRTATQEDFSKFRVHPAGHLEDYDRARFPDVSTLSLCRDCACKS
jgi:hypothetical protein